MRLKTSLASIVAGLTIVASAYVLPSTSLVSEPVATVGPSRQPDPIVLQEATTPAVFRVPSLAIEAPIKAVGLTPEGNMAAPETNTELGWYKHGVPPGNPGPAVLAAHTGLPNQPTLFRQLETLKKGDAVEVKDISGFTISFTIIDRGVYTPEAAPRTRIFGETTVARLVIITCTGTWLPKENTYSHRLVIYAVRNL